MAKQCAYCEASNPRLKYRKMPNGLYACIDCHRQRNPLWMAAVVNSLKKVKESDLYFATEKQKEEFREAKKKAMEAPPLHHIEASPIMRTAYKLLKKNKKVSVG